MRPSKRIISRLAATAITAIALIVICQQPARADNTLRGKRLKTSARTRDALHGIKVSSVTPSDTLRNPSRDSIQATGYDKPLRTNRETILITNSTSRPLTGIGLTITYTDMQHRQLHQRTDTLKAMIPAGETRLLRLATWDTQQSYYYHLSRRPRTADVTPYTITCHIDFILREPISQSQR